jgi:NADH:ubiquinone oxidoreductase subunit E
LEIEGLDLETRRRLKKIIEDNKSKPGALIRVLQQVQEVLGYLPLSAQKFISEHMGLPLSEVYG